MGRDASSKDVLSDPSVLEQRRSLYQNNFV